MITYFVTDPIYLHKNFKKVKLKRKINKENKKQTTATL